MAWWQGHAEQLEKPSSPQGKSLEKGRPYNQRHWEVGSKARGWRRGPQ